MERDRGKEGDCRHGQQLRPCEGVDETVSRSASVRRGGPGRGTRFPGVCPHAPGGSSPATVTPQPGSVDSPRPLSESPMSGSKRVNGRVGIDSGFCVNGSPNTRSIQADKAPRRVGNCWKRCVWGSAAVQNGRAHLGAAQPPPARTHLSAPLTGLRAPRGGQGTSRLRDRSLGPRVGVWTARRRRPAGGSAGQSTGGRGARR